MKIASNGIISLPLILVMLTSCNSFRPTVKTQPTEVMETALAVAGTEIAETQTAIPTATSTTMPLPTYSPLPPTETPIPAPALSPVSTQPGEQVYIDPDGWYSVAFPAKWSKSESSSYVGSDGFFETGYLPELGFVPDKLTVCEWLANIQTKNLYTVWWEETYRCRLVSRPGISPAITWEIIENPLVDLAHRFFYIKADNAHFARIASTFTWLRLVDEKVKPDFSKAALRPEDIAFWNNTSALPSNFSLKEFALPPEHQGENPSQKMFLDFVPPEFLPTRLPGNGTIWHSPTVESVNQSIAKYDYELRQADTGFYDLYQKGKLVLQNIYPLPKIYVFQTGDGNKLIFFAQTRIDPKKSIGTIGNEVSYLVQDEKISVWEKAVLNPVISGWQPIWMENKPLFLGLGDGLTLQVWDAQHKLVSSFTTYEDASVPLEQFRSWKNHWILAVSNFVVQDGEILNEKYNFEEVFDWSSINDKPFYFFRKGPRSGFSYNGQFFATYYNEILHGYCCGLGLHNPTIQNNTLRFFGRRDEVWYYVVLEIK